MNIETSINEKFDLDSEKLRDECGILGVYLTKPETDDEAAMLSYYGLYSLQHRGQESAGIAVSDGENVSHYKNMGILADVFTSEKLKSLKGRIAVGQVLYAKAKDRIIENAQPFVNHTKLGTIAVSFNGSLVNYDQLKEFLEVTKKGNEWIGFQSYFAQKYHTTSMYHYEATEICGSTEKAFDTFFEELENYLKERNVEILVVKEDNIMLEIEQQGCDKLIRIAFEIKKRPPLFLREKSLTKMLLMLQGFIYGYNEYDDRLKEGRTKKENIWSDFQSYFGEKYKTTTVYHPEFIEWCGSEEKAFDLFFEELESYLKEHNVEIPEIR